MTPLKFLRFYSDYKYGNWAIWFGRFGLFLKARWNPPLFSERNGFVTRVPLGFGWRFVFRRNNRPA